MDKKITDEIAIGIILVLAIIIGGIFWFRSEEKKLFKIEPDQAATSTISEDSSVIIYTDKNNYKEGEPIIIVAKNNLNEKIIYHSVGKFWNIEYFEEGVWKKFGYDGRRGFFQLADEDVGSACNLVFYELRHPSVLESKSNLETSWDQRICPFDEKISQYIGSGKYRFSFIYGFKTQNSNELGFRIIKPETVYSDAFEIN